MALQSTDAGILQQEPPTNSFAQRLLVFLPYTKKRCGGILILTILNIAFAARTKVARICLRKESIDLKGGIIAPLAYALFSVSMQ
jgi:hypothetical protein